MVLTPDEAANKVCCNETSSMKKCLTLRCMAWKEHFKTIETEQPCRAGPPVIVRTHVLDGKGYCGLTQ